MERLLADRETTERALLKIYDKHRHQLWLDAFDLVEDEMSAEDIVQSVIEKLWRDGIIRGSERQQLAYVRKAVQNRAKDVLAVVALERKGLLRMSGIDQEEVLPEKLLLTKEILCEINRVVDSFSLKEQALFRCLVWEGLSYDEISEMWHVNKSCLYVTMCRIRRKLRKIRHMLFLLL